MTEDPHIYCGLPWGKQEEEDDQDWKHPESESVDHDSKKKILKHQIKRKFAGSGRQDYSFHFDMRYEIMII
jgi:hypothetical protein